MTRLLATATALLILFVAGSAQEATPKRVIKFSGDSAYDFKAEVGITTTPDQTDARAVINAWCVLTDKRGGYDTPKEESAVRVEELKRKALEEVEATLLSETRAKLQKEARAAEAERVATFQSAREATEISDVLEQEGGGLLITAWQKGEYRNLNKDNEYQTSPMTQGIRYAMVKGSDGKWRIDGMEQAREEKNSTKENPVYSWSILRNHVFEFEHELNAAKLTTLKKPELAQATPQEAALSFAVAMRGFQSDLDLFFLGKMCSALVALTDDWFTTRYKEATRKEVDERKERNKGKDGPPPEVEEVKDLTETAATVVFKLPDNKASDKQVIKVVKVGETWRIEEAGDLRRAGTDKETYEPRKDIYRRW